MSVESGGRTLRDCTAGAGQCAMWRCLDRRRWSQAQPFSISAIPDGRLLRITVKNIGDFTSGVHALKPGTPVLVEGPFGKFVERPANPKVLLIAGGIGITPIRPLAEEMAADGFDVQLLYRAHDQGDIVFRKELDALASHHGVRVAYLLTETGSRSGNRKSWFEPRSLKQLVPDVAERAVYICGPQGMTKFVAGSLRTLGVASDVIRTEVFRLQ